MLARVLLKQPTGPASLIRARPGRCWLPHNRSMSGEGLPEPPTYHSRDFEHAELEEAGEARLRELVDTASAITTATGAASVQEGGGLRAWQRFHHAHRGAFFHPRMYIVSAFPELRCPDAAALRAVLAASGADSSRVEGRSPDPSLLAPAAERVAGGAFEDDCARAADESSPVAAGAAPRPVTIMELGAGNGSNLFAIRRHNPAARIYASDFSRAALKYISSAVARAGGAASDGGESARRASSKAAAGDAAAGEGGSAGAGGIAIAAAGDHSAENSTGSASTGAGAPAGGCPPPLPADAFRLFLWDVVSGAPPRPHSPASAAGGSGPPRSRSLKTGRGASPTAAAAAAANGSAANDDGSAAALPPATAVTSNGYAAESRHSSCADSAPLGALPASTGGRSDAGIAREATLPAGAAAVPAPPGTPATLTAPRAVAPDGSLGEADWAVPPPVVRGGCDIALLTFVLSAIPPEGHLAALRNVRKVRRRGDERVLWALEWCTGEHGGGGTCSPR